MSIMTDPEHEVKEVELSTFYGTPHAQEICNYVWDTGVPEVTDPWPHHELDDLDVRSMIAFLTGRPDVTGFLFEARDLEQYEADRTQVLPVLMPEEDYTLIMRSFR